MVDIYPYIKNMDKIVFPLIQFFQFPLIWYLWPRASIFAVTSIQNALFKFKIQKYNAVARIQFQDAIENVLPQSSWNQFGFSDINGI